VFHTVGTLFLSRIEDTFFMVKVFLFPKQSIPYIWDTMFTCLWSNDGNMSIRSKAYYNSTNIHKGWQYHPLTIGKNKPLLLILFWRSNNLKIACYPIFLQPVWPPLLKWNIDKSRGFTDKKSCQIFFNRTQSIFL